MTPAQVLQNDQGQKMIELAIGRAIGWGGDEYALMNAWHKLPEGSREMLALERFMQLVETRRGE